MYILQIIGGIIALGCGAELIVRGSVNLAIIYKLSGYFIGFSIVALGTSIPELAATITAITQVGSIGLALGNIIGSNIANILLILGLIACFQDIEFGQQEGKKNEPFWVFIITIIVVGLFIFLTQLKSSSPYTLYVGILLICILLAYLSYQFLSEKNHNNQGTSAPIKYSQLTSYIFLLIGFIFLGFGSYYFIYGSKSLAIILKVPDAIVGFTLVAFGTSLPELATGIVAAIRKQTNLAVGTILGSNIYNIAGIFAVILFVKHDNFTESLNVYFASLLFMLFVTFVFFIKIRIGFKIWKYHFRANRLGQKSGIIFVLAYLAYVFLSYSFY